MVGKAIPAKVSISLSPSCDDDFAAPGRPLFVGQDELGSSHISGPINKRRKCPASTARQARKGIAMGRNLLWGLAAAAVMGFIPSAKAQEATKETIKVAYIDPLSGGGASTGEAGLKTYQFIADQLNAKGGVLGKRIEIVGYDNKLNPQESLIQAQKAIDGGARIITQGNGSAVAAALTDFVAKYNDRNPGKEVLYLNYAAVDPVLTNEKCNYWHFRFDANADIKMEALTNYLKPRTGIKKVYLINQDYSFGQAVRVAARRMLAAKRPDIQIVGDELHPLQKITDFAPYVAKIKASGADTIITGNWDKDISLLLKAAADAGLQVDWYTYYADAPGGPTAIKQAGLNHRVFQVAEGAANIPNAPSQEFEKALRAKYDFGLLYPRAVNEMRVLAAAITAAKSTDPLKIAAKLEGMKFNVFDGGVGFMRADDHQFFQPMYIKSFGDLAADEPFDEEKTGWGWRVVAKVDTPDTILPTVCKMKRPS
jgi:branched-chain amino acid transport system substrate-binding protein